MYIRRIALNNIRCFENIEIEFSKNITILVGANNSGKSTILKSIYKLQENTSIYSNDIRSNKKEAEIELEISEPNTTDRELFAHKGIALNSSTNIYVNFNLRLNLNEVARLSYAPKAIIGSTIQANNSIFDPSEFKELPNKEDQNNFIYPYFSKRKNTHYNGQLSKDNTYSVLDSFHNLPAKIQKVTNQYFTKKHFADLCTNILGFEIAIIPGDHTEPKIGIYSQHGKTIPLEAMGDGVAHIIGFIATLLTEDGKLFLIEELENDIHPNALKNLLELIISKSQNNQFIITTHSNIVLKYLGGLDSTKIHYIESKFNTTKGLYLPEATVNEIPNTKAERIKILELLGYDFFDFEQYSGFLILEESSAERIIREFLIPVFTPSLSHKLRTIAAKGTSDIEPKFNDLHRLFLYIHRSEIYNNRAWVIVDGDSSGKETIEKLRKSYPSWNESHFTNLTHINIEAYYPDRFQEDIVLLNQMANGREKQKQKIEILNKVLKWIIEDGNNAKLEFEKSAHEIIEILKEIENKLYS